MLTDTQIREKKARADAATPGPWGWFGNTRVNSVQLATGNRGHFIIMDFVRWGMRDAAPRFQ
jgi:hypothetical protein